MANYVRKIATSDYTFLENKDAKGLFQIITCIVRNELGINHTCFVPKNLLGLKDFYQHYYNRALVSNETLIIRDYDERCKSPRGPKIKSIKVLCVECLDQNIGVSKEYREVLDSKEFAEWSNNYKWDENYTVREIKEKSITASQSLLKILKKFKIV